MANKKRTEQLDALLDWEKEGGRLPATSDLFNKQIAPTLILREVGDKQWEIETYQEHDGTRARQLIMLKHTTLIQLGLAILEAVKKAEQRFLEDR